MRGKGDSWVTQVVQDAGIGVDPASTKMRTILLDNVEARMHSVVPGYKQGSFGVAAAQGCQTLVEFLHLVWQCGRLAGAIESAIR